jgi:magnesium-transporting ATPase (P-type)
MALPHNSMLTVLLGDFREGILLVILALIDVGIVVYQDRKTERVLGLRDLASPRTLVIRDGVQQRIPGRDVVPFDIMIVSEGDRVAADAWLVSADELAADESLLTGGAVPMHKCAAQAEPLGLPPRPGGDGLPFVFSGSIGADAELRVRSCLRCTLHSLNSIAIAQATDLHLTNIFGQAQVLGAASGLATKLR